jgi:antitoxin component HigA of HigAB toxin-antitoxin module
VKRRKVEFHRITPGTVGRYLEELKVSRSKKATKDKGKPRDQHAPPGRHPRVLPQPCCSSRHRVEPRDLLDAVLRQDLDGGGLAYVDALSDLVIVYELEHHAIPSLPPHELLDQMLDEWGMSEAALVRATGLAKATVGDLVRGNHAFTVDQMHVVAKVFGLPGAVFLPRAANPAR